MSEAKTPSRQSANRIGQHLKLGLTNYIDHWQEWIVPMLVAAAFLVVSLLCCWLPYLIVIGPITCGLYCCALKALRGGSFNVSDLNRGWSTPGRSILAALVINLGMALPMILIYGLFFGFFGLIIALAPQLDRPGEKEYHGNQQVTEAAGDTDVLPGDRGESQATEALSDDESSRPEGLDGQQPQAPNQQRNGQAEEPPPEFVFGMIAGMLVFYALLFLAIIVCWLWMMWFGTRTMFVFPLIADRQLGFRAAWTQSWRETRIHFWELLIINFVASLLGMIGMYAMYIGLIFTMPIMFTIITSVYEERFPQTEQAESKEPSQQQ